MWKKALATVIIQLASFQTASKRPIGQDYIFVKWFANKCFDLFVIYQVCEIIFRSTLVFCLIPRISCWYLFHEENGMFPNTSKAVCCYLKRNASRNHVHLFITVLNQSK